MSCESASQKTLFAEDSEIYMNDLVNVLTEAQQTVVEKVASKSAAMCNDEISAFCLNTVLNIKPIWMYGSGNLSHFYIHPYAISAELKNYDDYSKRLAEHFDSVDDDDNEVVEFDFVCTTERASFVTLKNCVTLNNIPKLDIGSVIDSLYMPIYSQGHCSLLILSIPRRKFMHLDSIHNEPHRVIVDKIKKMFVLSGLTTRFGYRIDQVWTRIQSEVWECGWCALLFAEWWRNALADASTNDARQISLSHHNISLLAKRILDQQKIRKMTQAYDARLTRAYEAIAMFGKT